MTVSYRDDLATIGLSEKTIGRDYDKRTLPLNTIAADLDDEVLFRDGPLVLGHLLATCRFLGLHLDRIWDHRDTLLRDKNPRTAAVDQLEPLLGLYDGADVTDFINWNADKLRRWARIWPVITHRGGTIWSILNFVYAQGYRMTYQIRRQRRWLDSVIDPNRDSVYFDSVTFDSSWYLDPLAYLYIKFYSELYQADVGQTSVAATRRLTDAGATFLTDAERGSMIHIHDISHDTDDGDYVVEYVEDDTNLIVATDWATGGNNNLSYTLNWYLEEDEPISQKLIRGITNKIKPTVTGLEYLDKMEVIS